MYHSFFLSGFNCLVPVIMTAVSASPAASDPFASLVWYIPLCWCIWRSTSTTKTIRAMRRTMMTTALWEDKIKDQYKQRVNREASIICWCHFLSWSDHFGFLTHFFIRIKMHSSVSSNGMWHYMHNVYRDIKLHENLAALKKNFFLNKFMSSKFKT